MPRLIDVDKLIDVLLMERDEMLEHENYKKAQAIEYKKQHHRCVNCSQKDERTMRGLSYCGKCAERIRNYAKTHKEYFKEYEKRRRERIRAEHRCIRCRKPLEENYTKKTCPECLAVEKKRRMEKMKNESKT